MAKTFFDTNVLLYAISDDAPKANRASTLLRARGAISVQVLGEFVAVAKRKARMNLSEIRDALSRVRHFCEVYPLDADTHDDALDIVERYGYHIYDATIVASALRAGATTLYTEDLQDGQRIGTLTIRNPFIHPPTKPAAR